MTRCAGQARPSSLRVDPLLSGGFEVPESGDDLEAVVDGVAAAAALAKYLPVLEPGDDVLDAGPEPAMRPVVVVADDTAGVVASRGGDRCDAAVCAVAEGDTAIEQGATVWRATMTSLRLPGQHWLAASTRGR